VADTGFTRPTLAEIVTRIRGDMATNVTNSTVYLRRTLEWGLAKTMAGAAHLLYGAVESLSKNVLGDLATGQWLDRIAAWLYIVRQVALPGSGTVEFTWTASGQDIPAGTVLTDGFGNEYTTNALILDPAPANSATGVVTASYTGVASNVDTSVVLTITSPIAGINSAAAITVDFAGGSDLETDDELRARVLFKLANEPQGGSEADYVIWAQEVAGVDSVWVIHPAAGLPYIAVVYSGTAAEATVQAYLDDTSRKPVTADPEALRLDLNAAYQRSVTMTLDLTPNGDAAIEAAVEAQIDELFGREGGRSTTIYNSRLRDEISHATGLSHFVMTNLILDGGAPEAAAVGDITTTDSTIQYRLALTYI